ncbi:MAG: DNA polymerase III subunit alpha [Alphaproteobacteria bacterium]|nr:DNA polymerase III subunit alpha [Alphaproteobacteria bacterium]
MPELPPDRSGDARRRLAGLGRLARTVGDGSRRPGEDKTARPSSGSRIHACDPGSHASDHARGYAELQVTSNFSFLRGASHPDELVATAAALGQQAIAITDRNSFAGIVRAHHAAKVTGIRLVIGVRLDLCDGTSLLAYPEDRAAYGRLTRLLTLGKRRAPKGSCHLDYADVVAHGEGQILVVLPLENSEGAEFAGRVSTDFPDRAYLAAHFLYRGDDARRLARLARLSETTGLPLVAANDVLYHLPERRPLQDVVTCIREHCTIAEAGFRLIAHAERHLKSPREMARLFRNFPDALARTLDIAARCRFSLDELRYEYPEEPVPDGMTPQQRLAQLAWQGAAERLGIRPSPPTGGRGKGEGGFRERIRSAPPTPALSPRPAEGEGEQGRPAEGLPDHIRALIERELALIEKLDYARYFLTVHDIVQFARSQDILCQGRGSAANSVVCYCLGITSVDPARIDVLFERFISAARNEPPDIDVDFEHERREEVIQYIYDKYGRDRAGIAATVICYRARGAIREVGKVMGLSGDIVAALAGIVWGWSNEGIGDDKVREAGLDPTDRNLRLTLDLAAELIGFPRHLSQHVGGFVITRGPLSELVPIENAAMEDRTFIEWDKDDLDALGILKIDILALGMLTCIRKSFDLLARHYGRHYQMATIPAEHPAVYGMLSRADSLGVFQVESRAQMTMLPRLKPREFYDLVIEVAIVRPGPIQGDMVHPYLRRRSGRETVEYPSPELRRVLEKTMGVPLFQEQAMQIAIVGAGFSPEDADRLRRAMATFKRNGDIHLFRDRFIAGMVGRGYTTDFATRCFDQIEGFGTYGFPESHAASFALLVYVSAWIKCFHPDVFACALLNSQPMGFYAPAQIVRDAREHGVEVRPVDVNHSLWDCTLEPLHDVRHSPPVVPAKAGTQEPELDLFRSKPLSSRSPGLGPGVHAYSETFRGWPGQAHDCPVQQNRLLTRAPPQSEFPMPGLDPGIHVPSTTIGCSRARRGWPGQARPRGFGVDMRTGWLVLGALSKLNRTAVGQARPSGSEGVSRRAEEGNKENAGHCAVRLGFRLIKGLGAADAEKLIVERGAGYVDAGDLWRRSGLGRAALERLAEADALRSLADVPGGDVPGGDMPGGDVPGGDVPGGNVPGGDVPGGLDRRRALWALKALGEPPLPLFALPREPSPPAPEEPSHPASQEPSPPSGGRGQGEGGPSGLSAAVPLTPTLSPQRGERGKNEADGNREDTELRAAALLPEMPLGEHVVEDYASLGLTLKRHPLAFLRADLAAEGLVAASDLLSLPVGRRIAIAGLVLIRQRPGSANGVVFITIEDETGIANLIVWPDVLERFRRAALGATLLRCRGRLQREDSVIHVVADDLQDLTPRLHTLRDRTGAEPAPKPPFAAQAKIPGRGARDIIIPSRDFR